jgi:hypothetical protein
MAHVPCPKALIHWVGKHTEEKSCVCPMRYPIWWFCMAFIMYPWTQQFYNKQISTTLLVFIYFMERLERILTMVYVVQSYWACFGLYPSSCMSSTYKTTDKVQNKPNSSILWKYSYMFRPCHHQAIITWICHSLLDYLSIWIQIGD